MFKNLFKRKKTIEPLIAEIKTQSTYTPNGYVKRIENGDTIDCPQSNYVRDRRVGKQTFICVFKSTEPTEKGSPKFKASIEEAKAFWGRFDSDLFERIVDIKHNFS